MEYISFDKEGVSRSVKTTKNMQIHAESQAYEPCSDNNIDGRDGQEGWWTFVFKNRTDQNHSAGECDDV